MTAAVSEVSASGEVVVSRGLLLRYRALAFTTATLLIVLVFVGLPLQLGEHRPQVVNVVGTMHGFLYLAYLFVAFQLTRRLGVPKLQTVLVLLAGTVPFCAFIAERKMTRRFVALGAAGQQGSPPVRTAPLAQFRQRWLSPRALLLHFEVAVVAPGCIAAGWWQATRALAGNGLSWVYSIEWPCFAIVAVVGWWYLIHEDPEAYRARKMREESPSSTTIEAPERIRRLTVNRATANLAKVLAVAVALELVLGILALVLVPYSRPSGWRPAKGTALYFAHGAIGVLLAFAAIALLVRTWRSSRISRLTGWIGAIGVAIAGAGGLLTASHPLRIAGVALMLIGSVVAGFGYLFPTLEKLGDREDRPTPAAQVR